MDTLMAGASETVITSIKDKPEVYAELYARALVLADGEKQLAIVTADYGQFPLQYNKVLLDAIQSATRYTARACCYQLQPYAQRPGC